MSNQAKGIVQIHGRDYETVPSRVQRFREDHPDYTLETDLIHHDDEKVIMRAIISNGDRMLATGYAEEVRASSSINRTSALENCETSAIGRALAALGYAGTEYASANEVTAAIIQEKQDEAISGLVAHNEAWKKHEESIHAIKQHIAVGEMEQALEALAEIPEKDLQALRVAPTKGGWLTLSEQKAIKEAQKEDFDPETGKYKTWRTA